MLLKPKGAIPIIMGNVNAHLEVPGKYQEELMSDLLGTRGLKCISREYAMRSTTHKARMAGRGRVSWLQRRSVAVGEGRRLNSKRDYILTRPEDRKRYKRCRIVRLPNHSTDHRAIVVRVRGRGKHAMRRYRRGIARFPIQLPKGGPKTRGEALVEELQEAVLPPETRDKVKHAWIRLGTWSLIDKRAATRRAGNLNQNMGRRMARAIKASLKADRVERARKVVEEIMGHLAKGDAKEAWRCSSGWYKPPGEMQSKRCHASMERQTVKRELLYARTPSPCASIPCNVPSTPLNDCRPSDQEIRAIVKARRQGRAGNVRGMKAEHLKEWLSMVEDKEKVRAKGNDGLAA